MRKNYIIYSIIIVCIISCGKKSAPPRLSFNSEEVDRILHRMRFDNAIFTCTKIDRHPELFIQSKTPNTPVIIKKLDAQYPGIFSFFVNCNPLTRFF